MAYENLIYEVQESIGTITFNRPKALNALNSALLTELTELLDKVASDTDLKVLVLTGSGDKSFIAGADIKEISGLNALSAKIFAQKGHEVIGKLQKLDIPVIAAVNGFALGGGSEMALACDFIYASEKARFGLPEINLGLIPGFGGTQRLPRLIGKNMAKELIFTGGMISADEARSLGLVNRVFPPEILLGEVMKTAKVIAGKGQVSLREAKHVINLGTEMDLPTACAMEISSFSTCLASQDAKEGTQAFIEKRSAKFKGTLTD